MNIRPVNERCRILFLRSNSQSTFAAFIASGLALSDKLKYEQYPPVEEKDWGGIGKIFNPERGVADLNKNLIRSRQELKKKLDNGYFDLVLLTDYDGRLFRYQQLGLLGKCRHLAGLLKNIFSFDKNLFKEGGFYARSAFYD